LVILPTIFVASAVCYT